MATAGGVFVHAYELFMAMVHPAVVDPAIVQAAVSTEVAVANTSLAANPTYNFILNAIGVGTIASTIFIKWWIYLWSNRLAKKYDSNVLYANALHHRADALSSIVALAGLCGRVCSKNMIMMCISQSVVTVDRMFIFLFTLRFFTFSILEPLGSIPLEEPWSDTPF